MMALQARPLLATMIWASIAKPSVAGRKLSFAFILRQPGISASGSCSTEQQLLENNAVVLGRIALSRSTSMDVFY